jgi:hypothetical protein
MSTFAAISEVTMEPSWRGGDDGRQYSFLVTADELDGEDFGAACAEARSMGLPNPRVFTPAMLAWASIFHPAFFAAMSRHYSQPPLRLCVQTSPGLQVAGTCYWLQSMLFLAGVTLSAALVQNRFSRGTLASKLDRLWQAAAVGDGEPLAGLGALALRDRVLDFARHLDRPDRLLFELKDCFADAVAALAHSIPVEAEQLQEVELSSEMRARFGFRDDLAATMGSQLQCIIVYGSSVTSPVFADYDMIVVTSNRNQALQRLRGLAPSYRGVELNISVFEPDEFWHYQAISGDNLSHHGICIKGEAIVPRKCTGDLFARNFSFGFIRFRQILGMCAPPHLIAEAGQGDQLNLLSYFAKIPLNVAKGILGAKGVTVTKQELLQWAATSLNYSPVDAAARIAEDRLTAMATAAWATHRTMVHFNHRYCICANAS